MKMFFIIGLLIFIGIFISVDYQERRDENVCPKNSQTVESYSQQRRDKLQEAKIVFKQWEEQLNAPKGNSRDNLMDNYRNLHHDLLDEAIDLAFLENFTIHLEEQCYSQETMNEADVYFNNLKSRSIDRITQMNLYTNIPYIYPADIFARLGEDINLP